MRVQYQEGCNSQGRALCFHDFCISSLHIGWCWGTPGARGMLCSYGRSRLTENRRSKENLFFKEE